MFNSHNALSAEKSLSSKWKWLYASACLAFWVGCPLLYFNSGND